MSNVNIIGGDVNDSKISDRKEVHVPNSNTSTTSHNGNKLFQESNTTTYPTASVPPFTMHSDQYFMPPYTNPLGNLGLNTNSRQRPNSNQPRYSLTRFPPLRIPSFTIQMKKVYRIMGEELKNFWSISPRTHR